MFMQTVKIRPTPFSLCRSFKLALTFGHQPVSTMSTQPAKSTVNSNHYCTIPWQQSLISQPRYKEQHQQQRRQKHQQLTSYDLPASGLDHEQPKSPKLVKVAVVGIPNAGKSTLVNQLVGDRVSIVSPKEQTTRSRVLGIATVGDTQVLYFDTPGIISFKAGRKLKTVKGLISEAHNSIAEADVVLMMVDERGLPSGKGFNVFDPPNEEYQTESQKRILVVNKMDLLQKNGYAALQVFMARLMLDVAMQDSSDPSHRVHEVFNVCALNGEGVHAVQKYLLQQAVPAPWMYPASLTTDQSILMVAEEAIREQLFHFLHQELPYKLFQRNVACREEEEFDGTKVLTIVQMIMVETVSQQRMVIGKKGSVVNNICSAAERAIMETLNRPVALSLEVKVLSKAELKRLG
eukprot:m.145291 g.145291  ORF g.145291 m.145291 type:complete len:405 (-) comp30432_c0_seq3:108-1322(-)